MRMSTYIHTYIHTYTHMLQYTAIVALGLNRPCLLWFWGPSSIIVVCRDPAISCDGRTIHLVRSVTTPEYKAPEVFYKGIPCIFHSSVRNYVLKLPEVIKYILSLSSVHPDHVRRLRFRTWRRAKARVALQLARIFPNENRVCLAAGCVVPGSRPRHCRTPRSPTPKP